MKKIILFGLVALSLLFSVISCNHDNNNRESVINANDLPELADRFVTTYFDEATYQLIKKRSKPDADGSVYDVELTNNFEIDFDSNGKWIDIDGNHQEVPLDLIPEKIQTYVTAKYPNQLITAIDKEKTYIEIDLSNYFELVFDLQGNFIRIDN